MLARTLKMSVVAVALALAAPAFSETLAVDGQVAVKPSGVETPLRSPSMSAARRASILAFSGMSASAHLRMHA